MRSWLRFLVASAALTVAGGSHAATTTATPRTLQQVLNDAQGGDTVILADGDYRAIVLRDHKWASPVVVEAAAARLKSVQLVRVSNLAWHGGTFDGGDVERSGIGVGDSDHIVIDGTSMRHYLRNGIGFGRVSDSRIVANTFSDMGSDGVDVALSRRIVVDRNSCRDFVPTPKAHPDCVQLWSRPSDPPVADIAITNNTAVGDMQGFTMFNHSRPDKDGNIVDDGGFDRITVTGNVVRSMQYDGITLMDCRDCVVRDNSVETLPNPKDARIRSWLKFKGSTVAACGNKVSAFPDSPGTELCRD